MTKLCRNPRHPTAISTARFSRKRKEMCIRGPDKVPKTGLTKMLKQRCWPLYSYEKARKIDETIKLPDKPVLEETPDEKKERIEREKADTRFYKHIKGGTRVGNGLDLAISDCVRVLDAHPIPLDAFVNPTLAKSYLDKLPLKLRPVLDRLSKRKNPYFAMLVGWCMRNKCTPVAAQLPLSYGGVGTMADLIVRYESGVNRVVEIKTGCMNYLNRYSGKLQPGALANFTDCVLNQHYLQVLGTDIMYAHEFQFVKKAKPVILYFNVDGVTEYSPPSMGISLFRSTLESLMRDS